MGYLFLTATDFANHQSCNEKICCITFDDGYQDNLSIIDVLAKQQIPLTIFITTGFIQSNLRTFLSPTDLINLASYSNVEIGSHTVRHCDLTSLGYRDIETELLESKTYLQELLQRNILTFAYPFGSYNANIATLVSQHYDNAFAVYSSIKSLKKHTLPRLDINQKNIDDQRVLLKDNQRYSACIIT